MPTYEYRCATCKHELESKQKMSDAPLVDCPSCGKASLERLIAPTAFQLKGQGWYVSDYKKAPSKSADTGNTVPETADKIDKKDKTAVKETKPTPEKTTQSTTEAA